MTVIIFCRLTVIHEVMALKERIRALRKALGLTQKEFGARIGVKPNTIATYEIGRNAPIDAVLTLICREYGVSEQWLRTGEGEMFQPLDQTGELERMIAALSSDERIQRIIRAYWRLDEGGKYVVKKLIDSLLDEAPPSVSESPDVEAEARAEAEAYYRQILAEKRAAAISSASPHTAGHTKTVKKRA